MIRSLAAAVSGIDANQTMLDVVGNNIANTNTVGFKQDDVQFADLLSQQLAGASAPGPGTAGTNPIAVGSGVRVNDISASFTEGSLQQTGNPTDVAIQGNGFLVVQQNGQQYLTRAGNLKIDGNGNLAASNGAMVLGWMAGASTNSAPTPLTIAIGQVINPQATSTINLNGNLPVDLAAPSGGGSPSATVTTTVYDSLGRALPVDLTFTNPTSSGGGTTWDVYANWPGSTATAPGTKVGTASFGTGTAGPGQLDPKATGTISIAYSSLPTTGFSWPTAGTGITVNLAGSNGAPGVTDMAGQNTIGVQNQDGYASGSLQSYSIGQDGTITGTFSNGHSQTIGQIALANVANPGGLAQVGDLMYQSTPNSGTLSIGAPGTGGRGTLQGGSLEQSNVDMGTQLTNLIIAQNAYQANTKVVATSDQVLQSLVNMP